MNKTERRDATHNAVGEGVWGAGDGVAAPLTVLPIVVKLLGGGGKRCARLWSVLYVHGTGVRGQLGFASEHDL